MINALSTELDKRQIPTYQDSIATHKKTKLKLLENAYKRNVSDQ